MFGGYLQLFKKYLSQGAMSPIGLIPIIFGEVSSIWLNITQKQLHLQFLN